MSDTPQLLLAQSSEGRSSCRPSYGNTTSLARQCAAEGVDHVRYLVRLTESWS